MTSDTSAGVPSVQMAGNVFAVLGGPNAPEWRKIIRINGTAESGYTSEVVQDYTLVKQISDMVQKAMAEQADSDDTPEEQQYLMTAWQALAMYLSSCDDSDKAGALQALKMVSNLMNDNDGTGPLPTGTFGATTQTAATEYSCPQCSRSFGTEQGLINHLKNLHKSREKQPYKKPAGDAPIQDKD